MKIYFPAAPSFVLTALLLGSVPRAFPADLLVYNKNDSGPGSLRQAILDNNASPGGSTIVFSNVVTGTITLTSGELLITRHGTIRGPGAGILAVSGNATSRVFHVQITNHNTSALISGLSIINAGVTNIFTSPTSGGGIWNDHSILRVEHCVISDNRTIGVGAGIWNDGTLSNSASLIVEGTTFSNNFGGAIYNDAYQGIANIALRACTFSRNTAYQGGAIQSYGYDGSAGVTVDACTFSSNSAFGSGVFVGGGGIYNHGLSGNATLFINASTFIGNSAESGGSIYNNQPFGNATLEIGNSALQAGDSGGTIFNNFGTATSRGYNLSSDAGGGVLTNATDQRNTDPMLGPLADNGGRTFTHAPLPGSPVIDRGKWNAIAFIAFPIDQRGAPRPFNFASVMNAPGGDASDIGAFELASPQLNLQQVGRSAVLSWPFYYGDFALQYSTNLEASNWVLVGGFPTVVGNQYQQTNGPITTNRFYRLIRN